MFGRAIARYYSPYHKESGLRLKPPSGKRLLHLDVQRATR
jgi:hypothetical protein